MAEQKSITQNYATPYKFTGKELDEETGLYYFGARYYAPRESIWLSTDPLAEKYPNVSPYAYVANNPINAIDPDGRKIIVLNGQHRDQVLKYINARASGTFAFNKKGELYLKSAKGLPGTSSYYSSRLVQAINDSDVIRISISQTAIDKKTGASFDVDDVAGGGVTQSGSTTTTTTTTNSNGKKTVKSVTSNYSDVTISGNPATLLDTDGNRLRDDPEDILGHELVGHAIPKIVGSDTGNAVKNENKVREQLNDGCEPLRKEEPKHGELKMEE